MRAAWAVFRKELLEAVRDRRTLLLGLLLPVIVMPAVTLGLPYLALREEARLRNAPARVAGVGAFELREFIPAATAPGGVGGGAPLPRRGISAERLLPIRVEHASIRPADSAGRAQLAVVLPFFMTVWMLLGGQDGALDLGAGGREGGAPSR